MISEIKLCRRFTDFKRIGVWTVPIPGSLLGRISFFVFKSQDQMSWIVKSK